MRAIRLQRVAPETWAKDFAANAHLAVFEEDYGEPDKVDVAILGLIDDVVATYCTGVYLGSGCLHLRYGGAIKNFRGTPEVLALFKLVIKDLFETFRHLRFYVLNTNLNFLTLASREGFLVTGIRNFKGDTLLELTKELEG